MAKIVSPVAGYKGAIGTVQFVDGVAETDDPGVIAYCQGAGYKVSGRTLNPVEVQPVDSRDLDVEQAVGTRLRDAAVQPEAGDFLPPVNAGEADPHGPLVVAPGVHAVGPAPIRPGLVAVDDTDRQQAEETELAQAVLVDRQDVGEATAATVADLDDRGPLDLSDPGSARVGVELAEQAREGGAQTQPELAAQAAAEANPSPKRTRTRGSRRSE